MNSAARPFKGFCSSSLSQIISVKKRCDWAREKRPFSSHCCLLWLLLTTSVHLVGVPWTVLAMLFFDIIQISSLDSPVTSPWTTNDMTAVTKVSKVLPFLTNLRGLTRRQPRGWVFDSFFMWSCWVFSRLSFLRSSFHGLSFTSACTLCLCVCPFLPFSLSFHLSSPFLLRRSSFSAVSG